MFKNYTFKMMGEDAQLTKRTNFSNLQVKLLFSMMLLILVNYGAFAQAASATYTLTSSVTPVVSGAVTSANATSAGLTASFTNDATFGIGGTNWPTAQATPTPASATKYLQFSVTPTGSNLTINSLALTWRQNDGSSDYVAIFYSTSPTFATSTAVVIDNATGSTNNGSYSNSSFSASTTTGQTLYFRVYFYWLLSSTSKFGAKTLTLSGTTAAPTPPANDTCANATALPCGTSSLAGTTVNSVSETAPNSLSSPYGVWYAFTGDGNSTTINATTTAFDIKLAIFSATACGATYSTIATADLQTTSGTETSTFTTTNGTKYFVYIAYYNTTGTSTQTGTFTMSRTCPPLNNTCAGATALPCATSNLAGTTVASVATTPPIASTLSNYGVWYSFVGDGSSTTITETPSGWDNELLIVSSTGGCAGPFTQIADKDSGGSGAAETHTFTTVSGTQYYVYIAYFSTTGTSTDTGTFTISRTCSPAISTSVTTLTAFTQTIGTPSAQQTYTVSGGGLTASVVVTVPANYEISTTSGTFTPGNTSVTLAQSGGALTGQPVPVYVRLNAGATGVYNGNITHASTGATTVNVAVTGSTGSLPLTGTKTIDSTIATGGNNYISFTAAVNDLNLSGVGSGGVTFNVTSGQTFSETVPTITATGTLANPVVFQKNGGGANPIISSSGAAGTEAAILINGGDYFTFDGINIAATSSSLEYGYYLQNVSATNGAQNNTFKNFTVTLNRLNTLSIGVLQLSATATPATSTAGANSNNKFYNFTIKNANAGIQLAGAAGFPDLNCEIGTTSCATRNTIGDPATADDILNTINGAGAAVYGIKVLNQSDVKIYNNDVSNVTSSSNNSVADGIFVDNSAATVAVGTSEVYNNNVSNIFNTGAGTNAATYVRGIRANGNAFSGTITRIYNNFVSNLQTGCLNTTLRRIQGISLQPAGGGAGSSIYCEFNSVRIAATNLTPSNTCFEIGTVSGPIFRVRNNIFTNLTAAQSAQKHYAWVSTSASSVGNAGSLSNYNDLYVTGANGFVGLGNATDYATLANWQSATSHDANSLSIDPAFTSATNLHASAFLLDGAADPSYATNTPWANLDIDCAARSSSTDIGADEFTPPSCTGAVGGTAAGSVSFCTSGTPTITASGYSTGTGSTYQWYSSTTAGDYPNGGTIFAGQTNPAVLTTGIVNTTTYYWLRVTCTSGTATDNSNMITVTVTTPLAGINASSSAICTGNSVTLTENGGTATSWSWSPGGATTQAITVSPATTTTYTVTATVNGCSATANKIITVNPTPTAVSVAPTSATICAGGSVGLVASGGTVTVNSIYSASTGTISVAIPDNSGTGTTVTANPSTIPVGATITKVEVTYSITHTFSGDVEVSLKAPNGKIVNLMADQGSSSTVGYVNTVATSDTSATAFASGANPFTGTFKADLNPSSALIATSNVVNTQLFSDLFTTANGTWTILFYDDANLDSGTLTSASLKIYYTAITPASISWAPLSSGLNTYSGNTVTASPITSTSYTATSIINGCPSTPGTVAVTVNARPTGALSGGATYCNGQPTTTSLSVAVTGSGTISGTLSDGSPFSGTAPTITVSVSPSSTTTYTIATLSDANCTANAGDKTGSALVTVNARPTGALSGGATYCNGQSTTTSLSIAATGSGTISGTLSDGTPFSGTAPTITVSVSPSSTTSYTIATLSDANCTANAGDKTGSATVTVNPTPSTPTISAGGPTTFCSGGSVVLTSSAGSSYLWSNGATTQSITVTTTGNYTVQVTNSFECLSLASDATSVTVTPQPSWYLDADGDHYYTGTAVVQCDSPGTGYTTSGLLGGGDCADGNPAINPGAAEICYNNIDDNCSLTLSEGCAAVPVNMTASYNNTTLLSLATAIPAVPYSYPGTSNIKYRFTVTNTTTGASVADIIQTSRFVNIPGSLYSSPGTFTITASAVINDEVVPYAGNTITVFGPTIPKITLAPTSCGATLATLTSTLTANQGQNAVGYVFRIRDIGGSVYATSSSSTRFVNANSFAGFPLAYSTSYLVSVQYSYTDPVTLLSTDSGYGNECTITTPGIPTISMASPTCGSTVAALNAGITATSAAYATSYQFRIRLTSNVGGPYTEAAPVSSRFSSLTGFGTLVYNASYSISVRYSIGAQWSEYGPECILNTPNLPTTQLVPSQCGQEAATTLTQQLNIVAYPGFPSYRVRLTEVIGEDLGASQEIVVSYAYFRLNQFSIAQNGKDYNVEVAIKQGAVFGAYSTVCDIHTPAITKTVKTPFKAVAYPNPFANNFMLDVKTTSESTVSLKVYDMVGRLIDTRNVSVSDLETTTIGNEYPSGVYNVVVSQEDSVQTVRVVKR